MSNYRHLKADVDAWYQSGHFFDWDNSRIFYQKKGTGPVLLMVHGFPTAGCDWVDMAKGLTDHFTIVAPDIADAGHSSNPNRKTYRLSEHADMLEALMKHLNVSSAHLLGHDVGDAICQDIIERQNQGTLSFNVESCTFLNGGILMSAHRPVKLQSRLAGKYGWLFARLMRKSNFMSTVRAVWGDIKPSDEEIDVLWQVSKGINGRPSLARRSYNMIDRREHAARRADALKNATLPMCMINGIKDPISGDHACDAIAAELPQMTLIRLQGVGHFPLIEAPEQCVEHLLRFHEQIGTFKEK